MLYRYEPRILVVGVCASGKSTLTLGLRELGYNVRSFAQEHSVSSRMWRRLMPSFLIFLECNYETIQRRKQISWGKTRYEQQLQLLVDARSEADLVVQTDFYTPEQLITEVSTKLIVLGIRPRSKGDPGKELSP